MSPHSEAYKDGDVIRTNPKESFWGCAVILKTWSEARPFGPCVHIATTPVVKRHEYSFSELRAADFKVLSFNKGYRVGPLDYRYRTVTVIGIYSLLRATKFPVIGRVDPKKVFAPKLDLTVGDSTDGGFPLHGPIPPELGMEAVIAWREVHDHDNWIRELEEDQIETDAILKSVAQAQSRAAKASRAKRKLKLSTHKAKPSTRKAKSSTRKQSKRKKP